MLHHVDRLFASCMNIFVLLNKPAVVACSLGDIDTQEVEDAIMKHLESLWQAQLSSRLDWVCTRDVNGINLEALKQDQPDLLPDVCLFFVGPQPKERDLRFMTRLSKLVSVVPVIALADCMTLAECQDCQQKIFDHLQKGKTCYN